MPRYDSSARLAPHSGDVLLDASMHGWLCAQRQQQPCLSNSLLPRSYYRPHLLGDRQHSQPSGQ